MDKKLFLTQFQLKKYNKLLNLLFIVASITIAIW